MPNYTLQNLIDANPGIEKFSRSQKYKVKNEHGDLVEISIAQTFEKVDEYWFAIKPNLEGNPELRGHDGVIKDAALIGNLDKHLVQVLVSNHRYGFVEKMVTAQEKRLENESRIWKILEGDKATNVKFSEKEDLLKSKMMRPKIEGDPLLQYLIENYRILTFVELVRIALLVTSALRNLNENFEIIHNDVKPKNIIFKEKNGVITAGFVDFYQSQLRSDPPRKHYGTIEFIDPNVRCGDEFNSIKSDIYALGVSFAYIFGVSEGFARRRDALQLCKKSETEENIQRFHDSMYKPIPDIEKAVKEVNDTCITNKGKEIISLIMRMTDLDSSKRPTLSDVEAELTKLLPSLNQAPHQAVYSNVRVFPAPVVADTGAAKAAGSGNREVSPTIA
jgi:serine/threonine protein kinase